MSSFRFLKDLSKINFASLIGSMSGVGVLHNNDILNSENFAASSTKQEGAETNRKLVAVQIVFRHGARTVLRHIDGLPEANYDASFLLRPVVHTEVPHQFISIEDNKPVSVSPIEKYYKKTKFKGGVHAGILTAVGRCQAYDLGERIKKRYVEKHHLINEKYNPSQVYFRSTHMNRTMNSLESVVAGIYGSKNINKDDRVIFLVENFFTDILFPNRHCCPAVERVQSHYTEVSDRPSTYNEAKKIIHQNIVYPKNTPLHLIDWRDHIRARQTHGLEVPDFLLKLQPLVETAATENLVEHLCGSESDRDHVLPFVGGRFIHEIASNFSDVVSNNKRAKRLYLYSGHDSSLVPQLLILGIFDDRWPPYSADLAFELYRDEENRFWVQIVYCGKKMKLPGANSSMISLEDFHYRVSKYACNEEKYKRICEEGFLETKSKLDDAEKSL